MATPPSRDRGVVPCLIYADLLLGDRPPPLIDCNSDGGPDEHDEELEFHLDFTDDSSSENENMSLCPNPGSKEKHLHGQEQNDAINFPYSQICFIHRSKQYELKNHISLLMKPCLFVFIGRCNASYDKEIELRML